MEINIDICEKKLDRVEKLIGGFGGEKDRWIEVVRLFGERVINIIGDVFLSFVIVVYFGVFIIDFR